MCFRKIIVVSLVFFVMTIQGCTRVENSKTLKQLNLDWKKDVIVTFPAWTSENEKLKELQAQGKFKAIIKCGLDQKYKLIQIESYDWRGWAPEVDNDGRYLIGDNANRIGANIMCIDEKKDYLVKDDKSNKDSINKDKQQIGNSQTFKQHENRPYLYEPDLNLCERIKGFYSQEARELIKKEIKRRGLNCSNINNNKTVIASKPEPKSLTTISKKPQSEFPLKPIPINFPSVSVKRDDIAVIIGNANYKKQGKDIPNVNPAYADAEGIKQYFMKAKGVREGNIIFLKDATNAQLLSVFGNDKSHKGKLFNYIKPNKSNVYIYYAGHGAPGKEGDAYLVPTDTDSQTIEFTGYSLSTLYSNLGKLPAKSMTVILEACFSGGSQSGSLISRASPIVIQPKKTFIPNNIKVIAAGSERQMASWEEDSSHSLFTKYFLKAMSGEGDSNKDGKVSDNELKDYLSDTMTYYARRYYGRDQKVQIHNGG